MLPDELLETLNDQFPCRELQIRRLSALYLPPFPSPRTLIVHGLEATGKSSIVKGVLETSSLPHAIISSRECLTGRHLFERTVASCLDALDAHSGYKIDRKPYCRCENLNALVIHLRGMLEGRERFVLVFDGIDSQREAPPTLLPALARFGEMIPNLSIVMIVTVPHPRYFYQSGIPYLHFPPYTRDESIRILSRNPPQIFLNAPEPALEYTPDLAEEDNLWVWSRFLAAVWDALAKNAARDLIGFRSLAEKLWRPFVQPIVDGTFGTRDFSRLMVHRRGLFQSEECLIDSIVPRSPILPPTSTTTPKTGPSILHDLPYYSKYLLCAAYLASHNPARTDSLYFMQTSTSRRKKRGGGAPKTRVSKTPKARKIPRHLLSPSPFPLDRLLAIFRAILPDPVPQTADIYTQIATLGSIRLLVRTGMADVLDAGGKWRVTFGWEYAAAVGRSVGFEIGEFLAGGVEG
ncbi:hypothetical protein K432DRAFT_333078 [Lepidopterella palustris CBS 459.81]|uniref:Orc1-like AAA ATPase domain-containing protein n=1 Tax=Lepidopterella palustris CBS 459.81 TaxID=1314670 RepID=A0A8E2E603_9PEZI|nr:hypothetical protein K432DRAFT_333078 [Lepidopterella palustris CBS 459.81]